MAAGAKIVKATTRGRITIPIEYRRQLGCEGEGSWRIALTDRGMTLRPVDTEDQSSWLEELYEHFAPARAEAIERGYTDEEINSWIDEAVTAVRAERPE